MKEEESELKLETVPTPKAVSIRFEHNTPSSNVIGLRRQKRVMEVLKGTSLSAARIRRELLMVDDVKSDSNARFNGNVEYFVVV